MYLPGQIIHDIELNKPVRLGDDVWDKDSYPKGRTTHYIKHSGRWDRGGDYYILATPTSIEEAADLLAKRLIIPAGHNATTHCWSCQNWYSNCGSFKKCSQWEASKAYDDEEKAKYKASNAQKPVATKLEKRLLHTINRLRNDLKDLPDIYNDFQL